MLSAVSQRVGGRARIELRAYHDGRALPGSFARVLPGHSELPGAVTAGFMLGILQSFASMNEIKQIIPGIDQIIIYLVAVVIILVRPRGLMGRKGVMES